MGCFQSKKDTGDIHPNVFRVVNIDEGGQALWSGQLEVTETDLILYREGRDATYWPLASLRRYGFDGEIFSFESGRRCATGEGIYAFRCRRAAMLFRALQQNIQLRNVIQESLPFSLPPNLLTGSPPTMPRQTLQASVVHRSSVDNGQPLTLPTPNNLNLSNHMQLQTGVSRAATQSPRSPSSSDILEVMPLYPRPQNTTNQVTNVYQVSNEIKAKETNNNQAEQSNDTRLTHDAQRTCETSPVYSNDIIKDLAMLRQTLKKEARKRDEEEENEFLESQRYAIDSVAPNRSNAPLSPTLSNASEHYAQLSTEQKQEQKDLLEQKLLQEQIEQQQFEHEQQMLLEQEQKKQDGTRYYMNIGPNDVYIPDMNRNDVPTTPLTPKQPDYCNFGPSSKLEVNTYANLTIGEMVDSVNNVKHIINCNPSGDFVQKFSESDTYPSLSPVEELEVNYAVLDIDTNRDSIKTLSRELTSPESHNSSRHESTTSQCSAQARGRHLSQSSLEKTAAVPGGYTTIDFDKTVALTSVATTADAECARKTRHNSNTCGSPCSNERCRV